MAVQKVFVSGCFDLFHSGHLEFLQQAARFGDLYVAIGADATIRGLKGRFPFCGEQERIFMVRGLACVREAFISSGQGVLDFEPELRRYHPDLFVVNSDGDHASKRELCRELGIQYKVLPRVPGRGLPQRATSVLRSTSRLPFRLDLAGGWLDQPFVSRLAPGPVVVVSIEPRASYAGGSGLATSTRATAERLWGSQLPHGDLEQLARILFAFENPPGTAEVSGSQDALGMVLPGVNRLDYSGEYWPTNIIGCVDCDTLSWLSHSVSIRWLGARPAEYRVLEDVRLSVAGTQCLAAAAARCWEAILAHDLGQFGAAMSAAFRAQTTMFPRMISSNFSAAINALPSRVRGYKVAGAGGGGYLVAVAEHAPQGFEPIQVRHPDL